MPKEIVGIGAANVDIMGESAARLVMEDSNPGTLSVSVGGVTRNVCENTARLGLPTRLITTVGEDMYGEKIRSWCRECGIATDSFITLPGKNSSSYVSIHRSEMAVALSDMRILQELTPARLEPMRDKLSAAAAIVVDGCLPQETLRYIIRTFGGSVPIFADPVSTAYARRMRPVLRGIDTLKPNRLEAEILSGRSSRCEADYFRAAEGILAQGVRRVIISAGSRGCYYADNMGQRLWSRTRPLQQVENATGAGDSFMAGLLYSAVQNLTVYCLPDSAAQRYWLGDTMDFAMGAALAALQARTTINPAISPELIWQLVREQKRPRTPVIPTGLTGK